MKTKRLLGEEKIILPRGFRAAGIAAGIKKPGVRDMALIVSDRPAAVAGVFTTNQVCAATVKLDRERLRGGRGRAIVVNSGNANACTGEQGLRDARRMAALVAQQLGLLEEQVFVCSTGRIGAPLPMPVIEKGIAKLTQDLSENGGEDAAQAIMTTDTRPKRWTVHFRVGARQLTVAGIAKGAGMIEPNMATMLAFLMTDAAVPPRILQRALEAAVNQSFNRITVDGDRSTNDTVLLFANGAAGHPPLAPSRPGWRAFTEALNEATRQLARMIARDGEGATKMITIEVRGAASDRDADLAARAVANSLLVKTAWAGDDANWGRVMDALGYSPARVVESKVDIFFEDRCAVRGGVAGPATDAQLREIVRRPEFAVAIDLHLGKGRAIVYTCNLTEEYVRINV